MNRIKTYISNLPKSIKVLLLINIVVYFIFTIIDWVFLYDLNYIFGAYPTCSEKFRVYGIFTYMFTHYKNLDHIIGNLIFFLLFAPAVSRVIGDKNTIKLYIFSGLITFLSFNYIMNNQHNEIDNKLTKMGVDVKKLKLDNHGYIEMSTFDNTNERQKRLIDLYNNTNNEANGASGSILGFMIIYPFLFIKRKKSILLNLIVLYFVIDITMVINTVINTVIYHDLSELGTTFGHMGGIIGGIVFFIFWLRYLKNKN